MRFNSRIPASGFPRRELFRLMSMTMLLVIVGMLIVRTRDASMWRWMASKESDDESTTSQTNPDSEPAEGDQSSITERLLSGRNDLHPYEQSQAEYQFQAISDKTPLGVEDMPSYWRLMRWSMTESFDDQWERARKDRYFTHFAEDPAKLRGELVALKLHLRRSVRNDSMKNSMGVTVTFEGSCVSDESRGNPYLVVFYDKPPGFPIRANIHEEGLFVGYFLKLWAYQDALDKTRWAPLLIGRLRLRENSAQLAMRRQESEAQALPWIIGGAVVLFTGLVLWTRRYLCASSV